MEGISWYILGVSLLLADGIDQLGSAYGTTPQAVDSRLQVFANFNANGSHRFTSRWIHLAPTLAKANSKQRNARASTFFWSTLVHVITSPSWLKWMKSLMYSLRQVRLSRCIEETLWNTSKSSFDLHIHSILLQRWRTSTASADISRSQTEAASALCLFSDV